MGGLGGWILRRRLVWVFKLEGAELEGEEGANKNQVVGKSFCFDLKPWKGKGGEEEKFKQSNTWLLSLSHT